MSTLGSRRRRSQMKARAMTGINLTSMLDITFVLLIAFMVVAPALHHAMDVELPEATPPEDSKALQKTDNVPVVVSVQYGGTPQGPHPLSADGTGLGNLEQLEELARDWKEENRDLLLEVDWRVPYGTYLQTSAALERAGIKKVMLVYQPLES